MVLAAKIGISWKSLFKWNFSCKGTVALRGNTGSGFCEPLVTALLATDQYVNLFFAYFCLKVPYLIYTADSLTLNSQPISL